MTTLIGLSYKNIFAGKLIFQDCFKYDLIFLNSHEEHKTIENKIQRDRLYGKEDDNNCDRLDELDELDDIDYLLY